LPFIDSIEKTIIDNDVLRKLAEQLLDKDWYQLEFLPILERLEKKITMENYHSEFLPLLELFQHKILDSHNAIIAFFNSLKYYRPEFLPIIISLEHKIVDSDYAKDAIGLVVKNYGQ